MKFVVHRIDRGATHCSEQLGHVLVADSVWSTIKVIHYSHQYSALNNTYRGACWRRIIFVWRRMKLDKGQAVRYVLRNAHRHTNMYVTLTGGAVLFTLLFCARGLTLLYGWLHTIFTLSHFSCAVLFCSWVGPKKRTRFMLVPLRLSVGDIKEDVTKRT